MTATATDIEPFFSSEPTLLPQAFASKPNENRVLLGEERGTLKQ